MRGADQRPSPQAGAGERWTALQCELGYHRLLPVALRQAAPQRDGPHSHTPHTLYLLLMSWLAAVHTGGCTSQSAARWAEAKHISVPGIHTNRLLFGCSGNSCEVLMQRVFLSGHCCSFLVSNMSVIFSHKPLDVEKMIILCQSAYALQVYNSLTINDIHQTGGGLEYFGF